MDPLRFDRLSRLLATAPTRRTALAGVAGFLARLLAPTSEAAAQARNYRSLGQECTREPGSRHCPGSACQKGRCRCRGRSRPCRGKCLPRGKCCRTSECRGGKICRNGTCACAANKRLCAGLCIAKAACCRDAECGPCQRCGGGQCVTTCPAGEVCVGVTCVTATCGIGGPCRVFITSGRWTGNLGGVSGADDKCGGLAVDAGLSGTYKAWISDSDPSSSPSNRFTNTANTGPYVLLDPDATVIAINWADLTDGALAVPITVSEVGESLGFPGRAWTHTLPNGTAGGMGDVHCHDWTFETAPVEQGDSGFATYSDGQWTDQSASHCFVACHLYCFEQG